MNYLEEVVSKFCIAYGEGKISKTEFDKYCKIVNEEQLKVIEKMKLYKKEKSKSQRTVKKYIVTKNKIHALEFKNEAKAIRKLKEKVSRFKWTDKLTLEFVKIATGGSYGAYKNCKTIKDKLCVFKTL